MRSSKRHEEAQPFTGANAGRRFPFQSNALGPAWLRSAFGGLVSPITVKKYAVSTLIVVAVVATLVLLVRPTSGPPPAPTVPGVALSFHGLTNVPAKGTYVAFTVTNAGPQRVSFLLDAVEYFDGRGWITNSLRNMSNKSQRDWLYWYQDLTGKLHVGNWQDWGGGLEAGAVATFAAPILITNAPWRLHFHCVEQEFVDRTGDFIKNTASVITDGGVGNLTTFSGKRYYLISPEIAP